MTAATVAPTAIPMARWAKTGLTSPTVRRRCSPLRTGITGAKANRGFLGPTRTRRAGRHAPPQRRPPWCRPACTKTMARQVASGTCTMIARAGSLALWKTIRISLRRWQPLPLPAVSLWRREPRRLGRAPASEKRVLLPGQPWRQNWKAARLGPCPPVPFRPAKASLAPALPDSRPCRGPRCSTVPATWRKILVVLRQGDSLAPWQAPIRGFQGSGRRARLPVGRGKRHWEAARAVIPYKTVEDGVWRKVQAVQIQAAPAPWIGSIRLAHC